MGWNTIFSDHFFVSDFHREKTQEWLTQCHEEVPTFHQNLMYKASAGVRAPGSQHSRLRFEAQMRVISDHDAYIKL